MSLSVYADILASTETLVSFLETEPDHDELRKLLQALLHSPVDLADLGRQSRRFSSYLTIIVLYKFNEGASTHPGAMLNRLQEASPRQVLFCFLSPPSPLSPCSNSLCSHLGLPKTSSQERHCMDMQAMPTR